MFIFTALELIYLTDTLLDYKIFTDDILSRLLRTGDEMAFQEIYQRFWKKLYAVAYRKVGVKEVAEELIQDIFEKLWNKRESVIIENLDYYLFSAVKYSVINYIKSQITEQKYFDQLKYTDTIDTHNVFVINELSKEIEVGITALPAKTQEIFRLSRQEHLSVKEIAAKSQLSEKAVEYHITQALKSLRIHLKEYIEFCFFIFIFF